MCNLCMVLKKEGAVLFSDKEERRDAVVAAGAWSTQFAPQQIFQRVESVASSYAVSKFPKNRPDLIEKIIIKYS